MRLLVITPTLGRSPYIGETIDSVREIVGKTNWTLRHVLVAPSNTCSKLQLEYQGVTVLAEQGNTLYQALNTGLSVFFSDCDYWTYINDDDYLLEGFSAVLQLANSVRRPCVIYGKVAIINSNGNFTNRVTIWRFPKFMRGALAGRRSPLNQQGALWSKKIIEKVGYFDPILKYAADYDYFFRCANLGIDYCYVSNTVAAYRVHSAQLGQNGVSFGAELDMVRNRYKVSRIYTFICAIFFPVLNFDVYLWRFLKRRPFGTALFKNFH